MAQEPEETAKELIGKMDKLLEEVDVAIEQTDRTYAQYGIKRGDIRKFIDSQRERLSPEDRAKLDAEEKAWEDEVQREVEQELARQNSSKPKRAKVRRGAIKI